jgi:hypothetical protein
MSVSANAPLEDPDQLLLRWSDGSSSFSREEFVDVLVKQPYKVLVRSTSAVAENTPVYLIGKKYSANGVVRSCRKDEKSFVIAIFIDKESHYQPLGELDPGTFAIEDFLTEEQEAAILDNLDDGTPGSGRFTGAHPSI